MKINLLKSLPKSWGKKRKKDVSQRKNVTKEDRILSWRLDREYFDGTRSQGYAGYKFDGRWKTVAADMIKYYNLKDDSKILDIGCAKGFLLDEFGKILKKPTLCGLDISSYAVSKAHKKPLKNMCVGNANQLPYESKYFDLVLSINSLHNILDQSNLELAFKEIKRVSKKNMYVTLGSYKSNKAKKILDEWAVVASAYMKEKSWMNFFKKINYQGDYWWFEPK